MKVFISAEAREDLVWWEQNLSSSTGKSFFDPLPSLVIYADASGSGWGATCDGVGAGGVWTTVDLRSHINVLELRGALNALGTFADSFRDCTVSLKLDNTATVSYINRLGGEAQSQRTYEFWPFE